MLSPNVGQRKSFENAFAHRPTTNQELSIQKKEAWKVFRGIQEQVNNLQNVVCLIFSGHNKDDLKWNTTIGKLKNDLTGIEKKIEITKKSKKISAIEELKAKNLILEDFLKKLIELEPKAQEDSDRALKSFKNSKKNFKEVETSLPDLLKKAKAEAEHIKDKIDLYGKNPAPCDEVLEPLILRVKSVVPNYVILNQIEKSKEKDKSRITRYEEIKTLWKETSLKHEKAQDLSKRLEFTLASIPIIKEIQSINQLDDEVNPSLERFGETFTEKFSENFEEKSESRRTLRRFYNKLDDLRNLLTPPTDIPFIAIKLEDIKKTNRPKIQLTLEKISEEIKNLSNPVNSGSGIHFEDEDFSSQLKAQKEMACTELVKLGNKIEADWNDFCIKLTYSRFCLETVEKFKDFNLQLSSFYLDAEDIRGILRDTRKGVLLRTEHQQVFDKQKSKFEALSTTILASKAPTVEILPGEITFEEVKKPHLKEEYLEIIAKIEKDIKEYSLQLTSEDIEKVGLVWFSPNAKDNPFPNAKDLVFLKVAQQTKFFANYLNNFKVSLEAAYTEILPNMCKLAVGELNTIGSTLATASSDYDKQFYKAYLPENPLGRMAENGASTIAHGLRTAAGALSYVWSAEPSESEVPIIRQPHVTIESPFDHI